MRLTQYTDYSLRVLIYLALNADRRCTVREIAERYDISRNHLMKVVQQLASNGFVASIRGMGGGLRLSRSPEQIDIGNVVRVMEPDFNLVECFRPDNRCLITPACQLRYLLRQAGEAFLRELDGRTLTELVQHSESDRLRILLETGNSKQPPVD